MYGMSEKFGMVQLEGITGEYLDRRAVLQCSDETETKIDNEVRGIIKRAYERAYKLLKKNEAVLDAIAAFLYDHETITGTEFIEIYEKVSGKKVDAGKRLLSDSLLKTDKDRERDKQFKAEKESKPDKQAKSEKQKKKEALRKEGYYGAFTSAPRPEIKDEQAEPEITEAPAAEEKEEEPAGPMPWETYAAEKAAEAGPKPAMNPEADVMENKNTNIEAETAVDTEIVEEDDQEAVTVVPDEDTDLTPEQAEEDDPSDTEIPD